MKLFTFTKNNADILKGLTFGFVIVIAFIAGMAWLFENETFVKFAGMIFKVIYLAMAWVVENLLALVNFVVTLLTTLIK